MCGGEGHCHNCLRLTDGEWIWINLKTCRKDHTSWVTPSGDVLLVGGDYGQQQSTELVKTDGTTEVGSLQLRYRS